MFQGAQMWNSLARPSPCNGHLALQQHRFEAESSAVQRFEHSAPARSKGLGGLQVGSTQWHSIAAR